MKRKVLPLFVAALLLLGAGCSSVKTKESEKLYMAGQYKQAAEVFTAEDQKQVNSAAVLNNYYLGSCHFMAGNDKAAFQDFSRAYEGVAEQDRSFNWGRNYLARTYDGIMANTYQGLTLMFMNRPDQARVAFNRMEESLGKAAARNQKAIEERQKEVEKNRKQDGQAVNMLDGAKNNEGNQQCLENFQHLVDSWGAYGDFENPASRYISGVFRMMYGVDASDAEKAVYQLKRAYGMSRSQVSKSCYMMAENLANGRTSQGAPYGRENLRNIVFIIFENGLGPTKAEQRFNLFIPCRKPFHVGIALPKLVKRREAYAYLTVSDGTKDFARTELLCDFDRIVATEYKNELPGIIASEVTKAIIRVALQILANEIVDKQMGSSAALVSGIMGSAISYSVNRADIRNWNYLPKNFHACIVSRPASGILELKPAGSPVACARITLPPRGPYFVYIKVPAQGLPPMCRIACGL